MAEVEAVLLYRPGATGQAEGVPIGKTDDPQALTVLKESILRSAEETAAMWAKVDPGLGAIYRADLQRLREMLEFLLPTTDRPQFRVLREE